ncbi:MAG TPA: hypothetical protein VFI31_21830 [Pirellulales bacterium]|nr:hypothetical protein [Pirellulales bacterium]
MEELIHDRGRGPELVGTRITIYHLLPYFLDPTATETYICQVNNLTPEQVAASRAYILSRADAVLAEHLKIEERIATGIASDAVKHAEKARETLVKFKEWLAERDKPAAGGGAAATDSAELPAFRDWIIAREAALGERT